MKILHVLLRPGFGVCLFLSQFTSNRQSFITTNLTMILLGVIFASAGVYLLFAASKHLRRARETGEIATSGPFQTIRHPIYTSIYLLCVGLGFLFFAWVWFLVMIVFSPLWWLESKAEEKEMLAAYGEKYTNYQQRTKMFIPGIL